MQRDVLNLRREGGATRSVVLLLLGCLLLALATFGAQAQTRPVITTQPVGGTNLTRLEETILGELKELVVQLNLQEKVQVGNFIPDDQLADYYRAADLFVLSSRYEPFGMTAIEAMASGTPTVVTVHGGLYRALTFGRHALFADPFDKEDLGITMLKAFRHPRLRNTFDQLSRLHRAFEHRIGRLDAQMDEGCKGHVRRMRALPDSG